ncbi:unnamed protein product, partial [Brassica oleracea]
AGLWKSFLDDAIREEARLSMNNGTGGEVGLTGVRGDRVMKKIKKEENTWGSFWDEEFEFPQLKFMPEKDDFSGQTCLSVAS